MPLRLLARAAPIVLGAVAAAIWLQRRQARRRALPRRAGATPPPRPQPTATLDPAAPAAPAAPPAKERTRRFDPPPAPARPVRRSSRFVRASERRSIDIVTVVDDLLGATR